mmetsp:Transcript_22318/g.28617  ORF Transcript_22318/g.28617 Transcript_22318/m.28617 type:complete len:398 (-) Transcript_22318:786-1979(-)
MAASSDLLHGSRYKLLYKSKSGKANQSKSAKSSVLGKSSKSAGDQSSNEALVHRPYEASKSSKTIMETLLPLDSPSPYPSMVTVLPSMKPSSSQPVVEDTNSSPTALGTTPTHRPSLHPIISPHVHDIDTETKQPSNSPIGFHNLFTPSDDDEHHVDSSFAPSTTTSYDHISPAPSSTIQPSYSPPPPPSNMPSVASSFVMDPSASPVVEGLFGRPSVQDSSTVTPTLPTEEDTGKDTDGPTLKPSPSSSPSITITPPTNNEASFSFTVTLSSKTSFIPSSTPTESFTPSSYSSTSTPPSSDAPTASKELNLLNPIAQEQDKFQGAASLMVILACAMAIMGTLFGVFKVMKKDEESVLDEYGAQLAGAAAFDADDIGEVNVEGGGGGVDSHLQLVTD